MFLSLKVLIGDMYMEKKEIFFLTVICLEWKKTRPFLGNDTMLHVVYRCQYFILLKTLLHPALAAISLCVFVYVYVQVFVSRDLST